MIDVDLRGKVQNVKREDVKKIQFSGIVHYDERQDTCILLCKMKHDVVS